MTSTDRLTVRAVARQALFAAASLAAVTLFAATPIVVASAGSPAHGAKPPAVASNDAIADLGSMTVTARPAADRVEQDKIDTMSHKFGQGDFNDCAIKTCRDRS